MSVVPVSDALQRLSSEGLVESWPRVGTRVRIPTAQDIRGHYVVREALESQSARLFAQKSSPEERAEIQILARTLWTSVPESERKQALVGSPLWAASAAPAVSHADCGVRGASGAVPGDREQPDANVQLALRYGDTSKYLPPITTAG